MTTAKGTFAICGRNQPFSLQFTCDGPSCAGLDGFPNTTCTTDPSSSTLTCSNGVTCSGTSNFTSEFTLTQPINAVQQAWSVTLPDLCAQLDFTGNGTRSSGINFSGAGLDGCTSPFDGNSTGSAGPSAGGSNSTSVSTGGPSTATLPPFSNGTTTTAPGSGSGSGTAGGGGGGGGSHPSSGTTTIVTTIGTQVETLVVCSGTTSTLGATSAAHSSSTTAHSTTSSGPTPVVTSGAFHRTPPRLSFGFIGTLALMLLAFLPSAMALASSNGDDNDITSIVDASPNDPLNSTSAVDVSDLLARRDLPPFWKDFANLAAEYLSNKVDDPSVADTVVAEVESAVCTHYATALAQGALAAALEVDIIEEATAACMEAALLVFIPSGPLGEFAVALLAGTFCQYLVSEAFPGVGEVVNAICAEPKPCSSDLMNDPQNCGICGNVCPTGVCTDGACTSTSCTGQTCDTFGPCGPGGSCVCASTAEGTGFCVDGETPCEGLATCSSSDDCLAGEICAVQTCCEVSVCVGATSCGGSAAPNAPEMLFMRAAQNGTLGRRALV